ncbi:MAG: response regulator [Acidobacteria bacterium]|nr:response regulator [Acidobacteriota bacterium]
MADEKPSVLLVDDQQNLRDMLAILFDEWGYHTVMAGTATTGLRQAMERRFDLIILDNWLPDLEGIDLCKQIREFDRRTPIIFYSASAMGNEDTTTLQAGANLFVLKSAGLAPLRQAMAQQLDAAKQGKKF